MGAVLPFRDTGVVVWEGRVRVWRRGDDFVLIQITVSDTRTLAQKKALFCRVAELLGEAPGLRPEDVFVNLVEVRKENWSMGLGAAQYA